MSKHSIIIYKVINPQFKMAKTEKKFRVPGEIKRSRDLRGGRWSWTLKLA